MSLTDTGPAVRSPPSPVTVVSSGCVLPSTPEVASVAVQCTATSPLYQPLALGEVVALPDSVGAVSSTLMPETVALLLLPPLSVAIPVTDWLAPSCVSVVAPVQLATPLSASAQSNVT